MMPSVKLGMLATPAYSLNQYVLWLAQNPERIKKIKFFVQKSYFKGIANPKYILINRIG
jgi:hypothetical protein